MSTLRNGAVLGLSMLLGLGSSDANLHAQTPAPAAGQPPAAGETPVPGPPPAAEQPPAAGQPPAAEPPPAGNPPPATEPPPAGSPPPAGNPPPPGGVVPDGTPAPPAVGPPQKDGPHRYYFSQWNYHPTNGYFYTKLHYHEHHGDRAYKYHYVVCYPAQPKFAYYYDPGAKAYWGRYEYGAQPQACFCDLKPDAVGGDVTAAPAEAIGPPAALGKVPGAIGATANMVPPPPVPRLQ